MIKTIMFDLDGTILPMDLDEFIKLYFCEIQKKFDQISNNGDLVLKGVVAGTQAMMKQHLEKTNEVVFWETFEALTNIKKVDIEEDFEEFYNNEFTSLKKICDKNENMIKAVKVLKMKGYQLLLTTNPMFPEMAVKERLRWSGVEENSFDYITSYEYCHATKPRVEYYEEVIKTMDLAIHECMMVGNDTQDDGVIETLGIPLYLIEDYLITHNDEVNSKWIGKSNEFLKFCEKLPNIK